MSGDSYKKENVQAAVLAGETSNVLPHGETLGMLLLTRKFLGKDHPGVKAMMEEEMRYLEPAMLAIKSNPHLQAHFGHGIGGAFRLAPMLQHRQAMKTMEEILDAPGMLPEQRSYVQEAIKTNIRFK